MVTSTVSDAANGPALVLVATPIGNFDDMAPRAIDELRRARSVACEDTRRTGLLFKHFGIAHDPFIVCNDHNEAAAAAEVVARIGVGQRVALVSDAGMPAISDPGHTVVKAVVDAGFTVSAVPGPSAVLGALAISGLPTDRFCFEGFLPRKGSERRERIEDLASERRTAVLFESPRRVVATLDDLARVIGGARPVAIVRELTKTFEEVWRGSLAEAAKHYSSIEPLGEFVIVIGGADAEVLTDASICAALESERQSGASRRQAVDSVVAGMGAKKRQVYDLALLLEFD